MELKHREAEVNYVRCNGLLGKCAVSLLLTRQENSATVVGVAVNLLHPIPTVFRERFDR
jgi:hypothetical protein